MGRLGAHPNLVTIFDIGDEAGAPFVVTELMGGGDVEGELEKASGPLTLARTLEIAKDVARGLAFAHTQGIVHRDLKPGNVWLSSDGVAKIGDFGLAVAVNRSRLTLHGLMVGTVSYMPPEQALGGEVTPQADLYSLGAMLYELVTGKPPFQGDSPTAVISQHINTPPVAPSWNSQYCPPDLEALILRLLAKVPTDRPASAAEVVAALERVDPEAKSASHSDSQANPLDRLARGVFVGRERELERLRGALDNALSGHGSAVMLVGEPGIGKTRTTQELETYARMRGAQVLWGRANEAGGAPPFWPWLLAGRSYRAQNPDDVRRTEWGPYATELQRIFPALRDLFPNLAEPPPVDSEEGQFQLFDAMSGFLHGVSERVPLMIVLDDLHWADRATLQLLSHLARDLGRARILVLGTYRDTDLDRRHPLSQALAEMNREALFLRIPLRGLGEPEVRDYIARAAGVEPSRELVRRVFEETEGNPFFLSEIVNLMAQEGTLSAASVSAVAIPEGVREALGRRLDRLSEEANALLTTLAVAGREFDHALALELSGHDDETLLKLLEEAIRGRVLEEQGVSGYRFTHALMQETLVDEVTAARRVRLHARIAEALERRYGDARDTLPQLASHYAEAALLGREYTVKTAHYSRLAAEQAAVALAWEEAIRFYRLAIGAQQGTDESVEEGNLEVELAICLRYVGRAEEYSASIFRAAEAFRRGKQPAAFAAGMVRVVAAGLVLSTDVIAYRAVLEEALGGLAGEESRVACYLLAILAFGDIYDRGDQLADACRRMASSLGLERAEWPWLLDRREQGKLIERGDYAAAISLAESLFVQLAGRGAWVDAAAALARANGSLFGAGEIDRAEAGSERLLAFCVEHHLPGLRITALAHLATIAISRNRRSDFDALRNELGGQVRAARAVIHDALVRGETDLALSLLPELERPGPEAEFTITLATKVRALSAGAREAEARKAFEQYVNSPRWDVSPREARASAYIGAGDELLRRGDHDLLQRAYECLCDQIGLRMSPSSGDSADTMRGALAVRLGHLDAAEQHYTEGLEWARRPDVRFGLVEGRCLQGLAEVAERRGDIEAARTHLDAAGELFANYGAKLYLDQVLAKKQFLKA